jgi:hypothetical protein
MCLVAHRTAKQLPSSGPKRAAVNRLNLVY